MQEPKKNSKEYDEYFPNGFEQSEEPTESSAAAGDANLISYVNLSDAEDADEV